KNAAADRALAKDGGKPFFRLLEGKLTLLALGDVDDSTFNHAFAIGAADDDGAFQDPEEGSVPAPLRALVIQDLPLAAQIVQKQLSFRRMRVKRIHRASQGFLFGVETVHAQKRAVAVQQPPLKGGDVYGSQIIFKEDAILARRAVGHVGLVLKQGKDHAEGYKKLGQGPEETRRAWPYVVFAKKPCHRENAAPGDERSGGEDHAGGEAAEVPEIDKPGHIEEAEQVKIDSMPRMAQVSLAH